MRGMLTYCPIMTTSEGMCHNMDGYHWGRNRSRFFKSSKKSSSITDCRCDVFDPLSPLNSSGSCFSGKFSPRRRGDATGSLDDAEGEVAVEDAEGGFELVEAGLVAQVDQAVHLREVDVQLARELGLFH